MQITKIAAKKNFFFFQSEQVSSVLDLPQRFSFIHQIVDAKLFNPVIHLTKYTIKL